MIADSLERASQELDVVEAPSHQEIAERAFARFRARGGDAGHDLDDWLEAERELLLERAPGGTFRNSICCT